MLRELREVRRAHIYSCGVLRLQKLCGNCGKFGATFELRGFSGCFTLQKTLRELREVRRNFTVVAQLCSFGVFRMLYFAKNVAGSAAQL